MPRINYSCTCDNCHKDITTPNDENDVSFNAAKYVYCDRCYQDLLSTWEIWNAKMHKEQS